MARGLRAVLPVLLIGLGLRLFVESYHAYANWRLYLHLGDPSGAEFHELDVMLMTGPAIVFTALGCGLVGRWWRR